MALFLIQKICLCVCGKNIQNPNLSVYSERPIPTCSDSQKEKLDYLMVLSFHTIVASWQWVSLWQAKI